MRAAEPSPTADEVEDPPVTAEEAAEPAESTSEPAPQPPQPPPPAIAAPTLLPTGKGMWFHRVEYAEETPEGIIERARAAGLTHLYLRLGSSKGGFYASDDLDRLLPLAHAAGLRVVGWDFPYLHDPVADAESHTGVMSSAHDSADLVQSAAHASMTRNQIDPALLAAGETAWPAELPATGGSCGSTGANA